jgi:hypothetical protein
MTPHRSSTCVWCTATGDTTGWMHLKVGDSAAAMGLLCGEPIRDACWTQNPRQVTCPTCLKGIA